MNYKVETTVNGKSFNIQAGQLAQLAHGSALVTHGSSVVLVTAVRGPKMENRYGGDDDMVPLTVDYREKTSAAGKIPGGFFKREGRPSTKEILTMRLIDRPLRPLFPKTYKDELQVIAMVLSADDNLDPDVLAINGASAALTISDIPFNGPIAAVRVGKMGESFIINPTYAEAADGEMNLIVAGTADAVIMVEGSAKEVSEDTLVAAIEAGHGEIKKIVQIQLDLQKQMGAKKLAVPPEDIDQELHAKIRKEVYSDLKARIQNPSKKERKEALESIKAPMLAKYAGKIEEKDEKAAKEKKIGSIFGIMEKDALRELILEGKRIDGRNLTQVRAISGMVSFLPRTHGSALFNRGETQAMVVATLGSSRDEQIIDGLGEEYTKRFMLHYNFPSFSVGEVKPIRGPGRREIGHGNLAERALEFVLPEEKDFPYTIRIVSDILQSNGSSSMATVCGGTLSLMDAGVPIKKPVAGIAMGLVKENNDIRVLSDILGSEDHLGDMDFKVAGTADGITAFQMDVKIGGLSQDIIKQALKQATEGRLFILGEMNKIMDAPRKEISPFAPKFATVKIPTDKIGALIGPGGKNIKKIQADTGATIEVEEDGTVLIYAASGEAADKAKQMVEASTATAEIGKVYSGRVVSIREFGAFVEIMPGMDGLVHVSELSNNFVKEVTDVVKVGDVFDVKVLNIDDQGKIRLSRKALMPGATDGGDQGGQPRPRPYGGGGGRDRKPGGFNR